MTRLDLSAGSRAYGLFVHMEAAFGAFLDQLPTGIDVLARGRAAYHGDFDSAPFAGLGSLNPVLVGTPWLFWECFQGLEDKPFLHIAEAGAFYVLASVVLDHLVDGQTSQPGLLSVYHQALYSHAVSLYHAVFSVESPFWSNFQRLEAAHLAGLAAEITVQSSPADYTQATLAAIAHGKVAPIVTTLLALSHASGQPDLIKLLEASLNHIAVASQLLDDIGDWQADLQSGHLTYFLAQLAAPGEWERDARPELEALGARIRAEWVDVTRLKLVRRDLERSLEAIARLDCPAWRQYVQGYIDLTDEHLEQAVTMHLRDVFQEMK